MGTPLLWIAFNLFILLAIVLDLRVLHRKPHKVGLQEAGLWTAIWIGASVLFGTGVSVWFGPQRALEFFTGYLIEKSLSVDNLFLFLVIFRAFSVDERVQHRLLEWGVIGALLMRGAMIAVGAALIQNFSWVIYLLGAFLIYAGIHMLFVQKEKIHPENSAVFRFANRHLRVTRDYHGERFFVRHEDRLFATPLFLVLLVVEITDVTLAVDSIPATFGITTDPFIVYTSNVFAILGLRSMYFLLAGVLGRLRFLTVGLSFILTFIGAKMIAEHWIDIPVHISLGIVAAILMCALLASLLLPVKKPAQAQIASSESKLERQDKA
jgi:tellurite resistance protein TerC